MGKNRNKKPQLPLLPPEVGEDEIEVSEEDVDFLRENKEYAGFLRNLDTKTITKQVMGLSDDQNDDTLESYYEKRLQKNSVLEENDKSGLKVDPVDVLPVKTLSGKLYYKTDSKDSDRAQQIVEETRVESKASVDVLPKETKEKPTKAERRKELKQAKKQAKKVAKEERQRDKISKGPKSAVLEELKEDLSVQELFAQRKAQIAQIGVGLLADPEKNISTLKELLEMCSDEDMGISKLALLSLMAVFKDIVPGYRVRLPTEKEQQMKVSKEIKKMRDYESTLLRFYQSYLQKLVVLGKDSSFQQIAVRCMCGLLEAIPHFNFRESLLAAVIKHMSSTDDLSRKLSCAAVRSLFLNEGKHGGEATVEAAQLIADFVKHHNCCLHPDTIEVFLSISFDEDLGRHKESKWDGRYHQHRQKQKDDDVMPAGSQKSENQMKKHRLAAKLREEVEADFKAASSVPDALECRRMQTQTLAAIFKTYFRILKCSLEPQLDRPNLEGGESLHVGFGPRPLLVPCLDGLGKFSHLIDVDFMGDLLGFLQKLAAGNITPKTCNGVSLQINLTVPERLRCCIVAFKIVRSNLDALNIDLREFFVQLYNLLLDYEPDRLYLKDFSYYNQLLRKLLSNECVAMLNFDLLAYFGSESQGETLAEALQIMLCEGRQHDMQRAAAFSKRLASLSLQFGSAEAMAALATLKNLLQKYSKCRNLLENDGGGGSVGGSVARYQPEASDPEQSGALSSILWELALLSKHYHPAVSEMAVKIASMSSSHNQVFHSALSPPDALRTYSTKEGAFRAPIQPSKLTQKRKASQVNMSLVNYSVDQIEDVEAIDVVRQKFTKHFKVLRDIKENERLRRELNTTLSSLRLYEQYKAKKSERMDNSSTA